MRHALTSLAALALLAAPPAFAADQVLTMDPSAGHVTFLLGATGHDVEGSFPLTKCEVRFDPDTGDASGEISIDAAHGVTGNPKRDKTMHEKVLRASDHPSIVFNPKHVTGQLAASGPSDVKLEGTCSIAGAEHPLTLDAHVERAADELTVHSTFDVPFVEWGLKDPSVVFLKVEKIVHLTIDGEARRAEAPGPAATPAAAAPSR